MSEQVKTLGNSELEVRRGICAFCMLGRTCMQNPCMEGIGQGEVRSQGCEIHLHVMLVLMGALDQKGQNGRKYSRL